MTVYYVDDGGSSTAPYDTWAKAAPTLAALVAGAPTAITTGGNVVYFGADSISSGDGTTAFIGPTTGGPVYFISATVGTTTYAKSSSNQILPANSTGNSFTGNFAWFGIQWGASTADNIVFKNSDAASAAQSFIYTEDCTFKPGSNRTLILASGNSSASWGRQKHVRPTVSAINDSGAQSAAFINLSNQSGSIELHDASFVDSSSHRTGVVISGGTATDGPHEFSGADFSSLSSVSAIFNIANMQGKIIASHCKTAASPTWNTGALNAVSVLSITNSGSADDPTFLRYVDYFGTITSDTTNYRNSGATVEGTNVSWKMVSTANCYPQAALQTPWMYGAISATGSKTFTTYITQDGGAGDLNDNDVWLEVEYLGTASGAKSALGSDRCSISGFYSAAAAQTDDATSTWAGTITATYMQSLAVTATVNETGLYRARVVLGKASTTIYVDPLVTVS